MLREAVRGVIMRIDNRYSDWGQRGQACRGYMSRNKR